jgi:dihydrofolate reductase
MSRLVMWNLVTLDGFFEGSKSWDLTFHQTVWGEELERFSVEQLKAADGLVFGRITYEGMAAYWRTAKGEVADLMNALPKVVFSRTLKTAEWSNTTLVGEDAAARVKDLKSRGGQSLFVFGSANLSLTLMEAHLFDEYRILIAPVLIGSGTPLFGRGVTRSLRLLESRPLSSGGLILRYAPTD